MEEGEGFWNSTRIIIAVAFILGIIIGAIVMNQGIDPFLYSSKLKDVNSMNQLSARADARADQLYSCLVANNIDPNSCS